MLLSELVFNGEAVYMPEIISEHKKLLPNRYACAIHEHVVNFLADSETSFLVLVLVRRRPTPMLLVIGPTLTLKGKRKSLKIRSESSFK